MFQKLIFARIFYSSLKSKVILVATISLCYGGMLGNVSPQESTMLEQLINSYWVKLFSNCQEWSHLFSENGQVLDSVKFSVGLSQLQSYCEEFGTIMDAKFTVTTPMYANKVRLADNKSKFFVSHGMTFGGHSGGCPVLLESIQFYEIESKVGVNSFVIQQMFSDTPGLLDSVEKCLAEKERKRQEL